MTDRKNSQTKEVLEILQAVEETEHITQRHLAKRLGVALGLANSYLKRCIKKGLVKVRQAPANRYLYYLTPKGFAEKSRLTAEYLAESFSFYRTAGESLQEVFGHCAGKGWRTILLAGRSELAEIGCLKAMGQGLSIAGIVDLDCKGGAESFLGHPVFRSLAQVPDFDVCVLTDLKSPAETAAEIESCIGAERLLIPGILKRYLPAKAPEEK